MCQNGLWLQESWLKLRRGNGNMGSSPANPRTPRTLSDSPHAPTHPPGGGVSASFPPRRRLFQDLGWGSNLDPYAPCGAHAVASLSDSLRCVALTELETKTCKVSRRASALTCFSASALPVMPEVFLKSLRLRPEGSNNVQKGCHVAFGGPRGRQSLAGPMNRQRPGYFWGAFGRHLVDVECLLDFVCGPQSEFILRKSA